MAEAASPEMVERFKQAFEFWNCGEPDLMVDEYAEDGEFDLSAVFTGMAVCRGHGSMRRQLDELWETWEGAPAAGYFSGDVAREHRDRAPGLRSGKPGRFASIELDLHPDAFELVEQILVVLPDCLLARDRPPPPAIAKGRDQPQNLRPISTFSRAIGYSDRPAASRASSRLR